MLFELIATITLGVGVAGLILGVQKLTRISVARWVMPAFAGLAMLSYSLWSEYSWFARTSTALEGKIVAQKIESRQIWRPWTFIAPVTTRFIALEKDKARALDATVLTDVYLIARWQDVPVVPVAFDCLLSQRTDWVDAEAADITDQLADAQWVPLDTADPLLRAACDEIR